MRRSKLILLGLVTALVLGTAAGLSAWQLGTTSAAATPDMELAVTVPASVCTGEKCTIPLGAAFTLVVRTTKIPTTYSGYQTYVVYGSSLIYKPRPATGTAAPLENVADAAFPDGNALRNNFTPGLVFHNALTAFLPPPPEVTYTGNLVELTMNCSAGATSTVVTLVASDDPSSGGDGATYIGPDLATLYPVSDTLTINCGAAAGNTATPTNTIGAPVNTATPTITNTPGGPTNTPPASTNTPTVTNTPGPSTATFTPQAPTATYTPGAKRLGDVNDDGEVNSIDALLVLFVDADLTDESDLENAASADVNDDGTIDSIDALYILWIDAGQLVL